MFEDDEPIGERGRVERIVGDEQPHAAERSRAGCAARAAPRRVRSGRARRAARRAAATAARSPSRARARPVAPDRPRARVASRRASAARSTRSSVAVAARRAAAATRAPAAEPERDVLEHGEVREEQVVLEHDADRAPLGRHEHVVRRRRGPRRRARCGRGRCGTRPASARRNVVLPAPFGPRIATVSPSAGLQLDVEIERAETERDAARRGSSDTEPAVAQEREHRDAHREQHDAQADRDLGVRTPAGGRPRAVSSACGPGCCRRR